MGFINKLFKKRGYSFDDETTATEARARSDEIRDLKHQARLLEHQRNVQREKYKLLQLQDQISFYEDEINGDDEDNASGSIDEMFQSILLKSLLGQAPLQNANASLSAHQPPQEATNPNVARKISLSDDELKDNLKRMPKHLLKIARAAPEDKVREYLGDKFNLDDDTIRRGIAILKRK